jgi:hypothetical protein
METEIQILASYDKDTFRTHRYLIDEGQVVKGSIYIAKDADAIPERIVIELKERA